jgi:hypothetical protein
MAVIARQLGHAYTRMTRQAPYAFDAKLLADTIWEGFPQLSRQMPWSV